MKAINPATGLELPGEFAEAGVADIDSALERAAQAFAVYRGMSRSQRAGFLDAIAEEIEALGDELIERACNESGLPEGRIRGERGRTCGQLRMFAQNLREGSYQEAVIDTALPDRQPLPRADIRSILRPIGPVVVFTASNFPLAFSTAGGDTASALAAGCTVVVKAHESHPGTDALVTRAILRAVERSGMPVGTFASLQGGHELGRQLVMHPRTTAVAFTGSRSGGRALYDLAAQRAVPIPVFAEMGSVNPVLLLPGALKARNAELATQLAGSITLGVGQFCTKPGLIFGLEGPELDAFAAALAMQLDAVEPGVMLNNHILSGYRKGVAFMNKEGEVERLTEEREGGSKAVPAVLRTTGETFRSRPRLHEEVFGPFCLIVACRDRAEWTHILRELEGQLTATVMGEPEEWEAFGEGEMEDLVACCGRLIFNGVPTGVEVGHAMQHGGPYPATTDSRFTSVGSGAIRRFLRPVCYQSAPQSLLPEDLRDANPGDILRKVNGSWTRDPIL